MLPGDLLGAEPATHVLRDNADSMLRQAELFRDLAAHREDPLGRIPERECATLPGRRATVRLEGIVERARCLIAGIDDDLGLLQPGLGIAAFVDDRLTGDVPALM